MKNNKVSNLSDQEKCFLYMEIFQIFIYLIMAILQFSFSIKMYAYWSTNSTKYYYYLMNTRIAPPSYLADLKIVNDSFAACDVVGYDEIYTKHEFQNINLINNANPLDVTSSTLMNPSSNSSFTQNNSLAGLNYYNVDINTPGSTTINLVSSIPIFAWKNYSFCYRMINIDANQDAFQILPTTQKCKDIFGQYAVDCGSYRNDSFRLCIRKEYLTYSKLKTPFLDFDIDNTDENVCPYNNVRFSSSLNPNYDSSDPNSNLFLLYMSPTQRNIGLDQDSNLFVNIGQMKFQGALNVTEEQFGKEFPFISNMNTINIGQPYGFYDNYNIVVDSYDWSNFYNESTFYVYTDPVTGTRTSSPGFLIGIDKSSNYRLNNITTPGIPVYLAFWQLELLSKECYEKVFKSTGRTDVLGLIYQNKVKFITESAGILICWALVAIFISGFCQIYIRFYIIYKKLNDGLNKSDQDSELLSKLLIKFFQTVIFIVCMSAVIYNNSQFTKKINNLNLSVSNNCFDINTLKNMNLYSSFLQNLSKDNNLIMIFVICSFSGEGFIGFTYFLIWYQEYKEQIEKAKEEEEKRKAEEILLRAMKKDE
jgi:hypothetical protein